MRVFEKQCTNQHAVDVLVWKKDDLFDIGVVDKREACNSWYFRQNKQLSNGFVLTVCCICSERNMLH